MKILVTGGSGFLGTHVRKFFDADDLSRRTGLDILNVGDVGMAKDYDVVIQLAALLDKDPHNAGNIFLTNVDGTVNLLRQMKEDAVFIFASTKDVYGRFADNFSQVNENCPTLFAGQSPLEWSKLIAERYVEYYANAFNFRSCIFRLSTVYAPVTDDNTPNFVGHYVDAINKGERLQLPGGGTPLRDLLHVDDFSRACTAFTESVIRHGLYNLGGGPENALTLKDLVAKLEEVSGLQAVIDEENPLPAPTPLNYVTDISLSSQELGWSPELGLNEGLKTLF
ncbi:MAG TPA: NAD(P)-dependent oxidoreductase [Pyrinomonadaceae bacterium]|nr:NAD(P)-dependent oxidoreductase [Acidobacteriota bacterium]HQZ97379.1 NAD(P)-dependent oxidoreductase [Pyrinomonadaceae bacterium]